jgi:tripartite-type tricarboxylate transporter receptor subunit TctC
MTLIGTGLALVLSATVASAADWPTKTVQLIVPSKPGGGTDVMGRIFADYLGRETGGDVVVVNVDGGGGSIAYNQVMTAAPDGYTILFNHTGLLAGYHTGHSDIGLDSFTTIGIAQSYAPQVYAVDNDAKWNTLKEFVDEAREHPGERTVAVSLGRTTHFMAGLIMMNEKVDLKLLEASAEVDKVAAIQGGHIEMGNLGAASAKQYEQAGDMKVLCLLDPVPHPAYPEYQTCIQQGVNVSWLAPLVLWGPKGMDPDLVAKINAATANMANDAKAQEALAKADSVFTYYDVRASQELMATEDAKMKALAENLGLARN